MNRRLVRERVLQVLYQLEFQPTEEQAIIQAYEQDFGSENMVFYHQLIDGVKKYRSQIDREIGKCLKSGWSVERIASIDRAILRVAFYELLFERKTPVKVVINEAVEIAKDFSDAEASRFINGCLGKWVRGNG